MGFNVEGTPWRSIVANMPRTSKPYDAEVRGTASRSEEEMCQGPRPLQDLANYCYRIIARA